ncbi:thiamine diphosphokinase [Caproiciproducens galactitolivorans]|uniref:Thiamine diphosphokinase n=1 Tax=Caproiciproducens galactitolivorans TaxID=642589 RepID=A0ABT4BTT3_9FIRM|nr:thiamine diphosphokinase [Caproiciproducens galactitolivorans]MCY1714318.1 thiamine diphosphokinase [Caproiciproducens galactitolivorans]
MEPQIKKCIIIGSAPGSRIPDGIDFDNSYVICADGGLDIANQNHIVPDLLIGDFDSVKGDLPRDVETIRLQREKDDTDMMAAIREALQRGYNEFTLLCSVGGRMDHSYANLCALQYLVSQGCRAEIAEDKCRVFLLNGGRLTLRDLKGSTVSVFPFGSAFCTVSYVGMKYPLRDACISSVNPIGISNIILTNRAQVIVHSGYALIFLLS